MKLVVKSVIILALLFNISYAQKYLTKNGNISFYSETPVEDIEAHNQQVNCALDAETGDLVFKILIKSFEFEKALMQEHFNENYLESDSYPNSTFKGKVTNLDAIDFDRDGKYEALIEGNLTIHGVTNPVKEKGVFIVKEGTVNALAKFTLHVQDYGIKIPKTVVEKIAKEIEIDVDLLLKKL